MSDAMEFSEIKGEKFRVYMFAGGSVRIEGASRLCVRPSGTHRVETEYGRKFIVAAGWLAIEVSAEEWSF